MSPLHSAWDVISAFPTNVPAGNKSPPKATTASIVRRVRGATPDTPQQMTSSPVHSGPQKYPASKTARLRKSRRETPGRADHRPMDPRKILSLGVNLRGHIRTILPPIHITTSRRGRGDSPGIKEQKICEWG